MWLVIVAALLLVFVAVGAKFLTEAGSGSPAGRAQESKADFSGVTLSAKQLMNESELAVYNSLIQVVPSGYRVFPQVAMPAIIDMSPKRFSEWNKISQYYVDFAIVRASDRRCEIVVEVDGPYHNTEKQKERDEKKNHALELAGIRVVRLPAGQYSPDEIAQRIGVAVPGAQGAGATNGIRGR